VLFHSLFKVLCIFPSRYLFAIGLGAIFSIRRRIPPISGCDTKQPDSLSRQCIFGVAGQGHFTGLSPSLVPLSSGLGPHSATTLPQRRSSLQLDPRQQADFQVVLSRVRSPLLAGSLLLSFPALNEMLQFSAWSGLTG
jgi:hypothetical protein